MPVVSLKELAARMVRTPVIVHATVELAVKKSAVKVRDTAVKKFGEYQPAVGPFPAWEQLKPATIKQKEKAGGGEDPLIGHYEHSQNNAWPAHLRNTIEIAVDGFQGAVGTRDPIGAHHEYGAPKKNIPPRPFLRPALFENLDEIHKEMLEALVLAIRRM